MNIIFSKTLQTRAHEIFSRSFSACYLIPWTKNSGDIGDINLGPSAFYGLSKVAAASQEIPEINNINNTYVEANNIYINELIEWNSSDNLILEAKGNIVFRAGGAIVIKGNSSLYLKAGIEDVNMTGTVIFQGDSPQVRFEGNGKAFIHYNPSAFSEGECKYHNPYAYFEHVEPKEAELSYMLVNNVDDLQAITAFLHGNYALSRNIDASITQEWNDGAGFTPITQILGEEEIVPFTGNFDGNGFSINNLLIGDRGTGSAGLFGVLLGSKEDPVIIENLKLNNIRVHSTNHVGCVAGAANYADFINLEVSDCKIINAKKTVDLVGEASCVRFVSVNLSGKAASITEEPECLADNFDL